MKNSGIYIIIWVLLFFSCKKEEEKLVKNYYSTGTISAEVIDFPSKSPTVKLRFFVLDKSNNDGLIQQNIQNKLVLPATFKLQSFEKIKTEIKGASSTGILISDGLDLTINMDDIFNVMEPTVRKILHSSVPNNEVLLAKVGTKSNPLEVIGSGFTQNANDLDLPLAEICKKGFYESGDTLPLLESINSMIDYINANADNQNKNLFIFYTRRKLFSESMDINSLIYKAKQSNIKCHIIEPVYSYTWSNLKLSNFIRNFNAYTEGIYAVPISEGYYQYSDGELPMEMLRTAGQIDDMLIGGYECFEMIFSINQNAENYYAGGVFSSEFKITLSTDFEKKDLDIPFRFYINSAFQ